MTSNQLIYRIKQLTSEPQESEWLEFKHNFHSAEEIGQRISALANSACLAQQPYGYLIFGVEDQSHQIIGTTFKPNKQKAKGNEDLEFWLSQRLNPKIDFRCYELDIDGNAVVVYQVPAAYGAPVCFQHEAYIRVGSYTKKLKDYPDKARKIWHSMSEDWSAIVCPAASITDLDPVALTVARQLYAVKNPHLKELIPTWDESTFLNKARLTINGQITHSAIILLGLPESTHFINPAVAQITWILKGVDGIEKDYQHFYPPFLLAVDAVYTKIRNLKYRYIIDSTLFPEEVDQYDPYIIREALNNAIAHQDYRAGGRITIVESEASTLAFQNYGEFLPQTVENVLLRDAPEQKYRNPFLVSAMVNLNLIDTIGSGIRRMFQKQRERYFPMPDYDLSHDRVLVKSTGKVLNDEYAKRLVRRPDLSLHDIIALDKVQKNQAISDGEATELRGKSLIEGRKPNYWISAEVASQLDQQSEYIDMRGLDDLHYQKLILEYLKTFKTANRADFDKLLMDKLPKVLSDNQKYHKIKNLLQKMRRNGLIEIKESTWQKIS